MSDVDTAVSFTHHKPNVGALLAERAVPQGRTVAPSVTRSQTGGRQCDPTAWALALHVLCDHIAFAGDDNRVESRLLWGQHRVRRRFRRSLLRSRIGSSTTPQTTHPSGGVARPSSIDLDRDGGDSMNRRRVVADTVAFCGGGCLCPTRRVYSSCAAPVPFLCSGLHMARRAIVLGRVKQNTMCPGYT